jgi:drug/metabolite transporter (DMT)-like permease
VSQPPASHATPRFAVAGSLLTVYLLWGSTYMAIAIMIETLPPLVSAGVRYTIAGLLLAAILWWRGQLRGVRPSLLQWRSAAIVGTLLLLGGNGGVVLGEQYIPSGIAALLVATVPIWMALMDGLVTRRRPGWLVVGGLAAGIAGVAVLVAPAEGVEAIDPLGVGLVCVAAVSWAAGSIYARNAPLPRSPFVATAMEMLTGGVVLVIAGSLMGEWGRSDPAAFSLESILAVAYLIVFGSLVAFTAYIWLLSHTSTSTVATYAYVNPVVAVALGAVFLAEPITIRTLLASVIILAAVVAMVSGRPRAIEAATEPTADGAPAPEPVPTPEGAARDDI